MKRTHILASLVSVLAFSNVVSAAPFQGRDYVPSKSGEKVAAATINVNSDGNGFNCEIGLFATDSSNVEVRPGQVNILAFGEDEDGLTLNLGHKPSFKELRALANKITITNASKPVTGNPAGYVSYGLRVLDPHPEQLAYEGSFHMKHPGAGFQHVVETTENQRAAALMNELCNEARVTYNSMLGRNAIPSLRPIGGGKKFVKEPAKPKPSIMESLKNLVK